MELNINIRKERKKITTEQNVVTSQMMLFDTYCVFLFIYWLSSWLKSNFVNLKWILKETTQKKKFQQFLIDPARHKFEI